MTNGYINKCVACQPRAC